MHTLRIAAGAEQPIRTGHVALGDEGFEAQGHDMLRRALAAF